MVGSSPFISSFGLFSIVAAFKSTAVFVFSFRFRLFGVVSWRELFVASGLRSTDCSWFSAVLLSTGVATESSRRSSRPAVTSESVVDTANGFTCSNNHRITSIHQSVKPKLHLGYFDLFQICSIHTPYNKRYTTIKSTANQNDGVRIKSVNLAVAARITADVKNKDFFSKKSFLFP